MTRSPPKSRLKTILGSSKWYVWGMDILRFSEKQRWPFTSFIIHSISGYHITCIYVCSAAPNRFKFTRMHALETLFSPISLQFQFVSNTIRMHALKTLFLKISLNFQIVSNNVRMHAFKLFSAVPNRFKYRHNACFRDIVFNFFSAVQLVSNTVWTHALETL